MHSWNLEKIYLESVRASGAIAPSRHLVREYSSKNQVKQAIIDNNPDVKPGKDKKGAIRIQPKSKISNREDFTKKFVDTLDEISLLIVDVISPGKPESPSGKFPSYKVRDLSNNEFVITLGGGAFSNEGMSYERDILDSVKKYFDNPIENTKPAFLEKLEDFLNVKFDNIDKGESFERRVKRPLTDEGPENKGSEISDITLVDEDNQKYFISLKNIGGVTISNAGAGGMFDKKGDEVVFTNRERNRIGSKLMVAGGVNIERAVDGLEDYINKRQSQPGQEENIDTTDISNIEALEKFLGSAFDYGYIYVKQKNKKDDLEIADLTDENNLYNFIGNIQKVEVKYPYYITDQKSRKHISIVLSTTKGIYSFDIRNASGGIIPNQINLVKGKSTQETKAIKSSISKLAATEKEFGNTLSKYD